MTGFSTRRGFTLIELVLVVVIIAVLSLIAIPNFLEAQIRAKAALVQADMRTISMAIVTYTNDEAREPLGSREGVVLLGWSDVEKDNVYSALTTPIAYLTSVPRDPFSYQDHHSAPVYRTLRPDPAMLDRIGCAVSCPRAASRGFMWVLRSRGPGATDEKDFTPPVDSPEVLGADDDRIRSYIYDPTNGTLSKGWILWTNSGYYDGP